MLFSAQSHHIAATRPAKVKVKHIAKINKYTSYFKRFFMHYLVFDALRAAVLRVINAISASIEAIILR